MLATMLIGCYLHLLLSQVSGFLPLKSGAAILVNSSYWQLGFLGFTNMTVTQSYDS